MKETEETVEVIPLYESGLTLSFMAKGNIDTDVMKRSCLANWSPSQYEDDTLNLDFATILRGVYRWVPMLNEYGEYCGSRLIPAEDGSRGSFYATELILK